MNEREYRLYLMMRGVSQSESIFFPIFVVVEEAEEAIYGATVAGLEGRIAAAGLTEDDAATSAIDLFREIVDLALRNKVPLTHEFSGTIKFQRVPVPVHEAGKLFDTLEQTLKHLTGDESEEWRMVPAAGGIPLPFVMEAVEA